MAEKQLSLEELAELRSRWTKDTVADKAIESSPPVEEKELEQRKPYIKDDLIHQKLIDLLEQRNEQRTKIFRLATWYCWVSLFFLIAIVSAQTAGRIAGPDLNFSIFDGNELQVLVIGVFGQFVGLLYIITKSLYDDKNYKDLFKGNMKK